MTSPAASSESVWRRRSVAAWVGILVCAAVYLALGVWFVREVVRPYHPHTKFTSMLFYGEAFYPDRLPMLRDVPIYTQRRSTGYDAQFYSQIAVAGNPFHPDLAKALDSPAYRSHRILLPLLVHAAGFGHPFRVLNIFALSNLACWLVIALLLTLWWFPPNSVHNLLRWVGCLFGSGMVASVTHSLTDGPALLAIMLGVRCLEVNRIWLGSFLLGAAGLIRETSILCAVALVPPGERNRRMWMKALGAAALCALPTLIWIGVLHLHYGRSAGTRAVELPLSGLIRKFVDLYTVWQRKGFDDNARDDLLVIAALAVQVGFMLSRWQPKVVWWRVGAAFAVLGIFLGWPVWQGATAAMRSLLPATLAFNILVPRTRRGLVLLIAGNLTVFSAVGLLASPPTEQTSFTHGVTCDYGWEWFAPEHLDRNVWRWARGSATMRFRNRSREKVQVVLEFEINSVTARTVEVIAGDVRKSAVRKSIALEPEKGIPIRFGPFELPPGNLLVTFSTPEPPWTEPVNSSRGLTFAVHNLDAQVTSVPPANAGH